MEGVALNTFRDWGIYSESRLGFRSDRGGDWVITVSAQMLAQTHREAQRHMHRDVNTKKDKLRTCRIRMARNVRWKRRGGGVFRGRWRRQMVTAGAMERGPETASESEIYFTTCAMPPK